jgi:methylmalonyl-CoA mutase cobalamin-binding domain/chain
MPELLGLLNEKGLDVPIVIGGSVITPSDGVKLKEMGVAESFGPSVSEDEIIEAIKRLASERD